MNINCLIKLQNNPNFEPCSCICKAVRSFGCVTCHRAPILLGRRGQCTLCIHNLCHEHSVPVLYIRVRCLPPPPPPPPAPFFLLSINPSINQSINQPINQSFNQSVSQLRAVVYPPPPPPSRDVDPFFGLGGKS